MSVPKKRHTKESKGYNMSMEKTIWRCIYLLLKNGDFPASHVGNLRRQPTILNKKMMRCFYFTGISGINRLFSQTKISISIGDKKTSSRSDICGFYMYDIWYTGWWLNQPIWNISSSKWKSSPNRDENKQYLKPPPRLYMYDIWYVLYVYVSVSSSQAHINLLGTNMFSLPFGTNLSWWCSFFPGGIWTPYPTVIKVSQPCAMKRGGPGLAEASRPCGRMDGCGISISHLPVPRKNLEPNQAPRQANISGNYCRPLVPNI